MSKQRISVFKPTTDQSWGYRFTNLWWRGKWSPRFVEVSHLEFENWAKVCVIGNSGLEWSRIFIGSDASLAAYRVFQELVDMEFVNLTDVMDMGFVESSGHTSPFATPK
jgi:hypothetical protein